MLLKNVRVIALTICSLLVSGAVLAQTSAVPKRVVITIDDLPLNGPDIGLDRLRAMTKKIADSIKKNRVPAVGFVNESQLYRNAETDDRIAVLKMWVDAGVELGNHSYSHLGFAGTPLAVYEDDFIRGDTVIKLLMKKAGRRVRFFRHPFLQMGDTPELERAFEDFLTARGYRIAPVTVDSLDWLILSAYRKSQTERDDKMRRQVFDDYLKYLDARFENSEKLAEALFGRSIDQILLLHANELNAENFDRLIEVIRRRGYEFIPLEQALNDPAYRTPDKYSPTSDWLANWAASKGVRYDGPPVPDYMRKIYDEAQKQSSPK